MRNQYEYETLQDDVVTNRGQDYCLPVDYQWTRDGVFYRAGSAMLYHFAAMAAHIYYKICFRAKKINTKVLEQCKGEGIFLYGNHTQNVGDVLAPGWVLQGRRVYTLAGTANLGIPIIGRFLPALGALPVPASLKSYGKLKNAIEKRIAEGCAVMIYPEAHVWPYYTKIRPFPATSFSYPAKLNAPVFAMTTVYRKASLKRPRIVVCIDGPFYPRMDLPLKERKQELHDRVYHAMKRRSRKNNYEFCHYRKRKKE